LKSSTAYCLISFVVVFSVKWYPLFKADRGNKKAVYNVTKGQKD